MFGNKKGLKIVKGVVYAVLINLLVLKFWHGMKEYNKKINKKGPSKNE